jgi:hypothetical protein
MSRNASNKTSVWVVVGAIAAIGVLAAVGFFFLSDGLSHYRGVPELSSSVYFENANSMRGNTYRLRGVVDTALGWSPATGRMFSFLVGKENKGARPLPVLVPVALSHIDIQKGQSFIMKVEIADEGIITVLDMRKLYSGSATGIAELRSANKKKQPQIAPTHCDPSPSSRALEFHSAPDACVHGTCNSARPCQDF